MPQCQRCGIDVEINAGQYCDHCTNFLKHDSRSIMNAEWWHLVDEDETDRLFFGNDNPVKCRWLALSAMRPKKVLIKRDNKKPRIDSPNGIEQSKNAWLNPQRGISLLKDYKFSQLINVEKTAKIFGIQNVMILSLGSNKKAVFNCAECGDEFQRDIYQFTKGNIYCVKHARQKANLKAAETTRNKTRIKEFDVPTVRILQHYDLDMAEVQCIPCGHIFEAKKSNIRSTYLKSGANGCPKCNTDRLDSHTSKGEESLVNFIEDFVDVEQQKYFKPYSVDAFIEPYSLVIEYDGVFWHNEDHKDECSMQNRKKFFESLGYNSIHIFDYEWLNKQFTIQQKLKTLLKVEQEKYRAEDLVIGKIDTTIARTFLELHHLMGAGELRSDMCYGLFNKKANLISVCTFVPERIGNIRNVESNIFELNRYASVAKVYGAMTRFINLFFFEHLNAKTIYSYADYRFSSSKQNVYLVSGFEFELLTKPNYFWHKDRYILSRHKTQKHLLGKLLGDKFDPQLTEIENMHNSKWRRVFDAGHLKYIFKKK